MKFNKPLLQGKLIKRYKRFFADIQFDGKVVTAHVPNTGSLKSCLFPEQNCYFSESDNPERKLKYTLELVQTPTGLVGVNTSHPNKLVKTALESKLLNHWKDFTIIKPEYKLNVETRIDFLIQKSSDSKVPTNDHYIEVKNVSLMENGIALFPDAETTRGQKHLKELMLLKEKGHGAEILFVIQRQDVKSFSPAKLIDPEYARLLQEAVNSGVLLTPLLCDLNLEGIQLTSKILPFSLK